MTTAAHKPKVSLITPVFNRTDLLKKFLLSILSQSMLPDELIISDDGSSEDILSAVRETMNKAPFAITYVRQEDAGFRVARCRNNGVKLSNGDFLVFFDPDIVLSKYYFETLVGAAQKNRFIVGRMIRLANEQNSCVTQKQIREGDFSAILTDDQKKIPGRQYRKEWVYRFLHAIKLRRLGPKLRSSCFGCYKDDFVMVNGFDEKFIGWGNEDDDLGVRFYAAGIRGKNPFRKEYALHFFHEKFHNDERVNRPYQKARMNVINRKNYRCECGYENADSTEAVTVKTIKSPSQARIGKEDIE
ncbi:MAG: glycosyltransferase [Desulfobacterales bacterium]